MISIIGAGPTGNYLAYLLSKKNKQVRVFEEHDAIGHPIQCAGLLTSNINNIIKIPKSLIQNKIKRAEIIFKNKKIEVPLKNPNLVLDRSKFDNYLKEKAEDNGAKFFLKYKYKSYNKGKINFFKQKSLKTNYLIGADGPHSRVAKTNKLYQKRTFVTGIQARVNYKTPKDKIKFYLGYGEFGYVIPENNKISRVAVVGKENLNHEFKTFMKKEIKNYKLREYQSGTIPLYNPKQRIQRKKVFLVGDAATQTKATTYGGLVPGLLAAKILSEDFKSYEKNFKKTIGKELKLALMARNALNSFTEKDYEALLTKFNKPKLNKIISTYDRDFLTKFILKLLLRDPSLIKLGAKGYLNYLFK